MDDSILNAGPTKFLQDGNANTSLVSASHMKKSVLALDPKCLSCSGQNSTLISTFKMACLAYAPTPVVFRNVEFTRP